MQFLDVGLPKRFESEYNKLLAIHLLTGASYTQDLGYYTLDIRMANNIIVEKRLPSGKTRIKVWRDGLLYRSAIMPLGYSSKDHEGHCLYLKQYWPQSTIIKQESKTIRNGKYIEHKHYDKDGILIEWYFYDTKNDKKAGEYYQSNHGKPYSHVFIHNGEYNSITLAKLLYKGGPWFKHQSVIKI
jgi:hypothetical protein